MGKHTQGPWQLGYEGELFGVDPTGRMKHIEIQNFIGEISDEDKAHIVYCVNTHAELLSALVDAEFLMRQAGKIPGPMQDSFNRSAEDACAAINKAKGA